MLTEVTLVLPKYNNKNINIKNNDNNVDNFIYSNITFFILYNFLLDYIQLLCNILFTIAYLKVILFLAFLYS